MRWKFWRWWRISLTSILGLALFALAALQATIPHQVSAGQTAIGVATKVITGVLAIMLVRLMQDVMDRLAHILARLRELERDGDEPPP
jgi:sterol desaturase/sphingolipid hydroxylase (fatty acid hydroxylase superfamily)